jgi:hypothetical protein
MAEARIPDRSQDIVRRDGLASSWGLSSLLLGGVLLITAAITLACNILLWLAGPRGLDLSLIYVGGIVCLIGAVCIALCSVGFGIRGLARAVAHGESPSFALAGTLVSLLAVLAWIVVGVDLIMILETFKRGFFR